MTRAEWEMEGVAGGIRSGFLLLLGSRQFSFEEVRMLCAGIEAAQELMQMGRIVLEIAERVVRACEKDLPGEPWSEISLQAAQGRRTMSSNLYALLLEDSEEEDFYPESAPPFGQVSERVLREFPVWAAQDPVCVTPAANLVAVALCLETFGEHARRIGRLAALVRHERPVPQRRIPSLFS